MTAVKQVMAREPVVVHVDQSLVEAAARMRDAQVGALFAVDGDELVGVVTDRDLAIRGVAAGLDPSATAVIEVMTRHVVYCHADSSLDDVGGLMARQQVRRLAVVDDDHELVGVLSDIAANHGRHLRTNSDGKDAGSRRSDGWPVARIVAWHTARLCAAALHQAAARL